MPFEAAVILSQIVGMCVAFALTRAFVFERSSGRTSAQLARFALVNIVSLAQTWTVGVYLFRILLPAIGYAYYPDLTAHLIGLATSAVTSFFGHSLFSFARTSVPESPDKAARVARQSSVNG
jgi:putative flippase GtrA